jgi:hypothetical protein
MMCRYGNSSQLIHGVTPQNTVILIILHNDFKLHVRITFIFLLLQFCNFLSLTSRYSPITFHGKSYYRSYGWERQCACTVRCGCGLIRPFPSSYTALLSNVALIHLFPSYDSNFYTLRLFARWISPSQGLYEHPRKLTHNARKQTSLPRVKIRTHDSNIEDSTRFRRHTHFHQLIIYNQFSGWHK